MIRNARWIIHPTALLRLAAVLLLIPGASTARAADDALAAKDTIVRLLTFIEANDSDGAKQCYAEMTPDMANAMDAFIGERTSLRNLIVSLGQRFPDQVADLQKSELSPFTAQSLDREIINWRAASEKTLHDGSVLVRSATGSSAIVRNTAAGWRIDFGSMMEGRVPPDDANAVRLFVAQEKEQGQLCDKIFGKVKSGDYKSLLEAARDFDAQLDAVQLAHRPASARDSTKASAEAPNSLVSWSVEGPNLAIRAPDGSIKAWNFETGAVVATVQGHLHPHGVGGGVACGPGVASFALVEPSDSKSLRVVDAVGKPWALFSDFEQTGLLPNGMIQRLIGFTPDGASLLTSQNNDDYIAKFDLQTKRVTSVLELSKQLADPQSSMVVALRDASGFVHFQGGDATGYDFLGKVRWRAKIPNLTVSPTTAPFARSRPRAGTLIPVRPHIEDTPMVTAATAFWVAKDDHPTRIDVRTGAFSAMPFAGIMRDVVAIDADHGLIVTRDPDDGTYWLWTEQGQKKAVGDLSGSQRMAFSATGEYLLALPNPDELSPGKPGEQQLDRPIQVFHIRAGECGKLRELR